MIHLADVSEFQSIIDWRLYGSRRDAVIVRAHSGYRPDLYWQLNRDGARANVRIRGWYQYLSRSITPETQAAGFCNTVGELRPGEFVVIDCEEGVGDQTGRVQAWMAIVDKRLNTRSWLYTGEAFAGAHLSGLVPFSTRNVWLAAYRTRPPVLPHVLWQHTDKEAHPGIRSACDCSIFDGTADQLAALTGLASPMPAPAQPAPQPVPHPAPTEEAMIAIVPGAPLDGNNRVQHWECDRDGNINAWNGAPDLKSLNQLNPNHQPIKAIAALPDGTGVILVAEDGHHEGPAGPGGEWAQSTYVIRVGQ